jgi:hypothetical protein
LRLPPELRLLIYDEIAIPIEWSYDDYLGFFMSCKTIWEETRVEIPKKVRIWLEKRRRPASQPLAYDILAGFANTAPINMTNPLERTSELVRSRRAWFRNLEVTDQWMNPFRSPSPMRFDMNIAALLSLRLDTVTIVTHHWLSRPMPSGLVISQLGHGPLLLHEVVIVLRRKRLRRAIRVRRIIVKFAWSAHSNPPLFRYSMPPGWEIELNRDRSSMVEVCFRRKELWEGRLRSFPATCAWFWDSVVAFIRWLV